MNKTIVKNCNLCVCLKLCLRKSRNVDTTQMRSVGDFWEGAFLEKVELLGGVGKLANLDQFLFIKIQHIK